MLEQLERQLFSDSPNADHGFLHREIRSDGGRRGQRRKGERDVIREQDREDEVRMERKEGKKPLWEKHKKGEMEEDRGRWRQRDSSSWKSFSAKLNAN